MAEPWEWGKTPAGRLWDKGVEWLKQPPTPDPNFQRLSKGESASAIGQNPSPPPTPVTPSPAITTPPAVEALKVDTAGGANLPEPGTNPPYDPPAVNPPPPTPPPAGSLGGSWNTTNPDRPLPADVKVRGDQAVGYMAAQDEGWKPYLATPEGSIAKPGAVMSRESEGPSSVTAARDYRIMGTAGEASGVVPIGRGRGGFVGASTDAEAARNLKARAEQDTAASQIVASMNRGAEAERDTRAARLGIDRGTLDRMEGRNDTAAAKAAAAAQAAPSTTTAGSLWDRPGDTWGDGQRREIEYNNLLKEGTKRSVAAAQAMAEPFLAAQKAQQEAETSRNSLAGQIAASQYSADNVLMGKKLDAESSLYGSQLTAQTQAEKNRLEAEQKNAELEIQGVDAITRRDALSKQSGADQLAQAKIALSAQYAQAKTPAEQKAIMEQAAILGVRLDDLMMVGASSQVSQ